MTVRSDEQDATDAIAIQAIRDEALAEAVADAEPGDVVEIHELSCDLDEDADLACTCQPMCLRFGAVA